MKTKILGVWVAGVLALTAVAQQERLIGEWVPATNSSSGLGSSYAFSSNGTSTVTFGAVLALRYRVEGNRLVTRDDKGEMQKDFRIEGKKLLLSDERGGKETLQRIDGVPEAGLPGKWSGPHYTGTEQIMEFTTNMNCYFSVPIGQMTRPYRTEGKTLIQDPGELTMSTNSLSHTPSVRRAVPGTETTTWEVNGNLLSLSDSNGTRTTYIRKR